MNVLMDDLPCTITIAGIGIPINTDYRTGILFVKLNFSSHSYKAVV